MDNNFFEVNSNTAFVDGFWKWLFLWINYPGKRPAIEKVARRLLDRILGERKPEDYLSLKALTCPKVRLLLLINEEIVVVLNHQSLTTQRRTDLLQIRKDLAYGALQGVDLAVAPKNICVAYFEFALPTNSMRESFLFNEAMSFEEWVEDFRNTSTLEMQQEGIDDEFFMRNPVDTILSFREILEFLQAGEDKADSSIYLAYLRWMQTLSQMSEQWKLLLPHQWSVEAAQGFARFLEGNRPETAWGIEGEESVCIHYSFFPVPDEFPDLKKEIGGLGLDLCNNGATAQWEYLVTVSKIQKELPFTALWAVYHQLKERLDKLDFICYKKRFLSKTAVPVIAVPMHTYSIDCLDKIEQELHQIEWEQIQNSLNTDLVDK